MKNKLAALSLGLIAAGSLALPSFADPWFDHWDRDHDNHWTYAEFRNANRDWSRRHHERALRDAELRAQWDKWDVDHHGWVNSEQVREFHHWD